MGERRAIRIGAAILAGLGAALRLWHATTDPLWLDEAYTAYAADHGWRFLWHVVPRYETHPPFYYALIRLWTLAFGDSIAALRASSLLAGLIAPLAMLLPAREAAAMLGWNRMRTRRLAFAAFALACCSIPLVEMSREVRPYALMILVYTLALAMTLRLARRLAAGESLAGGLFAAWLVLVELLLWLHNLGPLWAVALGLALLTAMIGAATARDWLWLAGGILLVALAWLPAGLILLDQAPTWIASTWVRFSFATMWARLATLYAVPGWQSGAGLLLAAMSLAALWRAERLGRRLVPILLATALLPVLLSVGLTLAVAPVFITRTLTPVAVPTILALAIGATAYAGRAALLGTGLAVILGSNLTAVDIQARTAGPPQDWYGALDWLARRWRTGDLILAYPNEGALPMRRAIRDRNLAWPVRAIPTDVPSPPEVGARFATGSRGVPTLPPARLHAIAADPRLRRVPTLWLLRLGAETYDPGDVFLHELHAQQRYVVRHFVSGPIDIVGLRVRPVPAPDRGRR